MQVTVIGAAFEIQVRRQRLPSENLGAQHQFHGRGRPEGVGMGALGGGHRHLALTDALGNLVRFVLLPGQRFDTVGVPPLIEGVEFGALIADKAFDSNAIIADLNARGAKIVISQHPRRASPLPLAAELYKWRHLIENFFCKIRVQTHCPTRRQNRSELRSHDPSRRRRH